MAPAAVLQREAGARHDDAARQIARVLAFHGGIPHEAGDMIDARLLPDLRWIAQRYPIYVTDGYSGPLPNGEHVGCHGCHVKGSDHHYGLAVDIVPLTSGRVVEIASVQFSAGLSPQTFWVDLPTGQPFLVKLEWNGRKGGSMVA